jgi:biopolymer transport protein ExbD
MAIISRSTSDDAMMDINTTPLIDVMLVLLIMFIITIPIRMHAVKLDLPAGAHQQTALPVQNEIAITQGGSVLWNGKPANLVQLRRYLDQSQTLDPLPQLRLRPAHDTRYEVVDQVLAVVKRANVTQMAFVGNQDYANDF